jgi:hypothetical protein
MTMRPARRWSGAQFAGKTLATSRLELQTIVKAA